MRTLRHRRWGAALVVLVTATTLASCSPGGDDDARSADLPAIPQLSDEVREQRGSIVSSEDFVGSTVLSESGARAVKVVYGSASGLDGTRREVSGTVFVPAGSPPAGGWPIVSYGHGTTGITNDCGPSQYPALLGYDLVVASLVKLGYLVTMSDFEGLGHPGEHPYLEPVTAGYNIIDAVRAARAVEPRAGSRWAAVGVTQGGQATWAANELADDYGDGLEFLGSASINPAADLTGTASLADSGWLSRPQQFGYPLLVEGLSRTARDLVPADYLHGVLAQERDAWLACTGPLAERRSAISTVTVRDYEPATRSSVERLREALEGATVGKRPTNGPMLVITGEDDETIPAKWVTKAVERACALDAEVEYTIRPGEGHDGLNSGARVGEWLGERFAGADVVNTC